MRLKNHLHNWLNRGLQFIPTNLFHLITSALISRNIDLDQVLKEVQLEDFKSSYIPSIINRNKEISVANRFEVFIITTLINKVVQDTKPKKSPNYFTRLTILLPKQSREEIISDLHAMRKDLLERGTPKWYITIIFVAQFASIVFHSYYFKL